MTDAGCAVVVGVDTNRDTHYAVVVDATTIQLVSSRTDAVAGTTKALDLQLAAGSTGAVAVAGLNLARYNYRTTALTGTPLSPQALAILPKAA